MSFIELLASQTHPENGNYLRMHHFLYNLLTKITAHESDDQPDGLGYDIALIFSIERARKTEDLRYAVGKGAADLAEWNRDAPDAAKLTLEENFAAEKGPKVLASEINRRLQEPAPLLIPIGYSTALHSVLHPIVESPYSIIEPSDYAYRAIAERNIGTGGAQSLGDSVLAVPFNSTGVVIVANPYTNRDVTENLLGLVGLLEKAKKLLDTFRDKQPMPTDQLVELLSQHSSELIAAYGH